MGMVLGVEAQGEAALQHQAFGNRVPVQWDSSWDMPDSIANVFVAPVYTGQDQSIFAIGVRSHVPLHTHKEHTESILVLEGEGWMQIGEDSIFLIPGQLVVIPANTVHGVRTTSDRALRVWSIQAPEFHGVDRHWVEP